MPIRSLVATRPWQPVLEPLSGCPASGTRMVGRNDHDGESYGFDPRGEQHRTLVDAARQLAEERG